ncbi:hypothetical protein APHAL10511_003935 [Amanita phalloides]|nr:hypothetical protein APHAL10511_003935 [Amanita phalloides]
MPLPQPIVKSIIKAVLPSPLQSPLVPMYSQPPVSPQSLGIIVPVPQKPVLHLAAKPKLFSNKSLVAVLKNPEIESPAAKKAQIPFVQSQKSIASIEIASRVITEYPSISVALPSISIVSSSISIVSSIYIASSHARVSFPSISSILDCIHDSK